MKLILLASILYDAQFSEKGGGTDIITKAIADLGEKQKGLIDGVKAELTTEIKSAKEEAEAAKKAAEATDARVNGIEAKMATGSFGGNGGQKSYEQHFEEKLTESKDKLGKGVRFTVELGTKAVGNMGSSANLTGSYFVPPTVVPGVVLSPYNSVHMRNLIPTGTTNSNLIRHIRDNGGEGGPTTVAEAGTKPQIDRDLSIVDAPVRKIATYFRVPEEMIEDIPYLTSFLTQVGTEEVLAVEDAQILYGDGTGQNLTGIGTSGSFTAFAADAGGGAASGVVTSPNEFDVLRAADKQMRVLKRTPSVALVSPVDYFKMISRKDSTNNYILSGGGNGLMPTVNGFPIVQLNQVTAGDFFVMDRNAVQLFFRANISVRFYEQDQDNAIKNMVTIVIEERIALPIYYVNGIIKGTFAAGITDLTS